MNEKFNNYLTRNKKNKLVLLFSLLFSFPLAYSVTLDLFLISNDFVRIAVKFVFPIAIVISTFVSYGLYFIYSFLVLNLFRKVGTVKFLYGPLISSIVGSILAIILYLKSGVDIKLGLTDIINAIILVQHRKLAWDLNWNYLPKIFLLMFVLTILVDLLFVLLKFKQERLKWVGSVIIAGLIFLTLTVVSVAILFTLQFIITLIIGGGGVA